MAFSTACRASKHGSIWILDIACHFLFYVIYGKYRNIPNPNKTHVTRLWRKSIIYVYKTTFNTLCKSFIPIFLMCARGKILYRVLLYTICHLFKISWGPWWCMKSKRFIIKFWNTVSYAFIFKLIFTYNRKWKVVKVS